MNSIFCISKLFSLSENDLRSEFLYFIICDLLTNKLELNSLNLYNSPFMKDIKKHSEWIEYCYDITKTNDSLDIRILQNIVYQINKINKINSLFIERIKKIVQQFFKIIYTQYDDKNNIIKESDITHDVSQWYKATHITRMKEKMSKFLNMKALDDNTKKHSVNDVSHNTLQFKFTEEIIHNMLKSMINNIPPMEQIEMCLDNMIDKCIVQNSSNFTDNIMKCMKGKEIDSCKRIMAMKDYKTIIVKEVQNMDVCTAVNLLTQFGFKMNPSNMNSNKFESYEAWEKRYILLLELPSINEKFSYYIKLLLERVNPINELKKKIEISDIGLIGGGIKNVISKYKDISPFLSNIITKHNKMEEKYHIARYIVINYNQFMKIFNNKKIFNYNNMALYKNYYDRIHYKYLVIQKELLDSIENKLNH